MTYMLLNLLKLKIQNNSRLKNHALLIHQHMLMLINRYLYIKVMEKEKLGEKDELENYFLLN